MTKRQMIQTIQQQEATAFLRLKEATRDFGPMSSVTTARRSIWCTLDDLMQATGIKPDNTLPEQHAAVAIMNRFRSNPNI